MEGEGRRRGWTGARFPLGLAGGFGAVALLAAFFHEPWRDEVQFWVIARESRTFAELQLNLLYANQTRAWPWLLFALTRVFPTLWAMQVLHVLIAAAAVATVAACAPFPRWAKILFAFGYYPLFEYGVISRSYGLGLLLTAGCCALVSHRRRPHLALGVLLCLLAQASAFAVILAVALGLAEAADVLFGRPRPGDTRVVPWQAAGGFALLLAGAAVSIGQMVAPSDGRWQFQWGEVGGAAALVKTVGQIWSAYVPVPQATVQFWNTNLLDGLPAVQAVLGLALAAWTLTWAARRPAAWVAYASGAAATLLLVHTNHFSFARHIGHLFVLCLVAAWLSVSGREWRAAAWQQRLDATRARTFPGAGLTALLGVQLACGLYAVGMDVRFPFSGGLRVARLIRDGGYGDVSLAVHPGGYGPSVTVYLDRPFYAPDTGRWGRFVIHDSRVRALGTPELLADVTALARRTGRPVLLLTRRRLEGVPHHVASVPAIEESYQVYWIPTASEPAPPRRLSSAAE